MTEWCKVKSDESKEEIRIPHRAGWKILSVKNANWRNWTVVAQDPLTKQIEEHFLFA